MSDPTENIRREVVEIINSKVESNDESIERKRLENEYGQVWDTNEATNEFEFLGFMAPYAVVRRRSDGVKGSVIFQHSPRFYFRFKPE